MSNNILCLYKYKDVKNIITNFKEKNKNQSLLLGSNLYYFYIYKNIFNNKNK